jgi:hypothetical protein
MSTTTRKTHKTKDKTLKKQMQLLKGEQNWLMLLSGCSRFQELPYVGLPEMNMYIFCKNI